MNVSLLCKVIGLLLVIIAGSMGVCLAHAWATEDMDSTAAFARSGVTTSLVGLILIAFGRRSPSVALRKEGIAIVGLGWIISALFGALPFLWSHPGLGFADAVFESMSGFSTTGATVYRDLEIVPPSILLWRSLSQWLGGLGILVLFVALLSTIGVGSKALFRHESTARASESPQKRIRDTALQLWLIYVGLSAVCCLGYLVLGLDLYDSIVHAMTSVATGGFSPYNGSIGHFNDWRVEAWTVVFMILGSLNFLFYASLIEGRRRPTRDLEELKLFFAVLATVVFFVAANLSIQESEYSAGRAFRDSLFQVTSLLTTTGFATADYEQWPVFSLLLLVMLMGLGGCGGSTCGSIKLNRWLLFAKMIRWQLLISYRPNLVLSLKVNGENAREDARTQTLFYIALAASTAVVGVIIVSALEPEQDLMTVISVTLATLLNVGPALGSAGPTETYAGLTSPTKLFLTFLMALGRLEFFAILVLFLPSLWRKY